MKYGIENKISSTKVFIVADLYTFYSKIFIQISRPKVTTTYTPGILVYT